VTKRAVPLASRQCWRADESSLLRGRIADRFGPRDVVVRGAVIQRRALQRFCTGETPVPPDRSGLHKDSVVNCSNLITIRQQDVLRVMGKLSPETMDQIDASLKAALGLH
jgi:mRNA-degrading endonuclease toxin of MazEF toxin-antitoxin module